MHRQLSWFLMSLLVFAVESSRYILDNADRKAQLLTAADRTGQTTLICCSYARTNGGACCALLLNAGADATHPGNSG